MGNEVSPSPQDLWRQLTDKIAATWQDAEMRLIALIRDSVAHHMGAPQWAVEQLAAIESVRRAGQDILNHALDDTARLVEQTLQEAADAGQGAARIDLDHAGMPTRVPPALANAIALIAADTMAHITGLPTLALRGAIDVYQSIIHDSVAAVLTGSATRVQATQEALDGFAKAGVRGFIDKSGRAWSLDAYAEMATRTGAMHAMITAQTMTLQASGARFVIVDSHGYSCPLCGPWQGKILSIDSTPPGVHTVLSDIDDRMVGVAVAGTIDQARQAGLWHPNCAHAMGLYLPGITPTPTQGLNPVTDTDREAYKLTQRQRAIEREIRRAKRLAAAALTPEAEKAAHATVRTWQARRRQLLAQDTNLRAKPRREQARTAH